MSRAKRLVAAVANIEAALLDITELKEEIESWYGNMEGTKLEYTEKYEKLTDCASELEDAEQEIQSGIDNLNTVEFPTMFS